MGAGDPAEAGLDQSTVALRRLMVRAVDDDAARVQTLASVAKRRVWVATWPHSPESVRTLTNSDGEQAMPLFSGLDVLQEAARRFGWHAPDGSMSHRELDAIEALRGAVANAVHFVVFDICADHSVEFALDEVATALRSSAMQMPRVEPPAPAPAQSSRATGSFGEVDAPFGRERTTGLTAIIEERPGRGTRPDPRAEPSIATPLGAVAVARVAVPLNSRSTMAGTPMNGTFRRPERIATPAAFDAARPAPARPATPAAFAAVQPEAPAAHPKPARPATPPPFDAVTPPAMPAVRPVAPPVAAPPPIAAPVFEPPPFAAHADLPSLDDGFPMADGPGDFAFGSSSEEPEAKPAALEAAAMMQQVGKMAKDAATQQAAAEVAAMLKQMAMKGGIDESQPTAAQSAAKALAAMLAGSAAAAPAPPPPAPAPAAAAPAPAPAVAPPSAPKAKRTKAKAEARAAAADAGVPEPAEDCVLCPLATPLEDGLLSAIADDLRKYPEVEWACEVSDGTKVPVIGVRIDPSFMTNVREIKNAIARAGSGQSQRLAVLVLSDPQQMKEARAQGNVFFPWRKRAKR